MQIGSRNSFFFRILTSPSVLPVVFFLLSLFVIYSLWFTYDQTRIRSLERETSITAEQIKLRLEAWVDSRTAILELLAGSLDEIPDLSSDAFSNSAYEIIVLYPGFQAINLIDEDWVIRIVVPESTNQAALNKDIHKHPDPRTGIALQNSLDTNTIHRSPMVHLLQGKPGFATYYPAYNGDGSLIGIINGVFVMEEVVNRCLSEEKLKDRYAISIMTLTGETVYSHTPADFPEGEFTTLDTQGIRIVDKNWSLGLTPLASVNHPLLLNSVSLLMIGGFVLALALCLLLRAYLLRLTELRLSRENYKILIDTQLDMVIRTDPDHRVTFASPSTIKKMGLAENEIIGRLTSEFTHPDDLPILVEFRDKMKTESSTEDFVLRVKNGSDWAWISWTSSNHYNQEGHRTGTVSVGRDITGQREMESRLLQGQKLQAVGQLAGGIAHDFNNIIQAILGYLGFVKLGLDSESDAFEDLTQAENAADRAATLTRQLLAFSRRQILQPEILDLDFVTSDILPMLRRLLTESITLEFIPRETGFSVMADRNQIEQILVNLCVNARDAIMGETGSISIDTSETSFDEDFCNTHAWAEPGHWVRLCFSDDGQGMNEDILAQVFEPFFTTKETGKGSGLGLATVYGIIKQHEGLVEVVSQPGQGTSFAFYLRAEEAVAPKDEVLSERSPQSGSESILLVEDEEMVRDLTCRILEKAGFKVTTAENGQQAFDIWTAGKQDFDLMIFDVVMPLMGGRELARLIRLENESVPILFVSGYDSQSFRKPLTADEPTDLLIKPFNREKLLELVREILDR